jgi:hypothetical protein
MLYDVVEVRALRNYRIWVRFEDGLAGEVDLSNLAGRGVFRRASWWSALTRARNLSQTSAQLDATKTGWM